MEELMLKVVPRRDKEFVEGLTTEQLHVAPVAPNTTEDEVVAHKEQLGELRSGLEELRREDSLQEAEIEKLKADVKSAEELRAMAVEEAKSKAVEEYKSTPKYKEWLMSQFAPYLEQGFVLGVQHTKLWNEGLLFRDDGPTFRYWLKGASTITPASLSITETGWDEGEDEDEPAPTVGTSQPAAPPASKPTQVDP